MNEALQLPVILPALPEIVLAVGAMLLLMIGVFRGEQATGAVSGFAIILLIVAGVLIALMPAEKVVTFGGSFVVDAFARFMKILALIGSAVAIVMSTEFLGATDRRRSNTRS